MNQFITGTFSEAEPANKAVDEIIAAGHPRDDISIIMSSETHHRFWDEAKTEKSRSSSSGRDVDRAGGTRSPIGTILAASERSEVRPTRDVASGTHERFIVAGPAATALVRDRKDSQPNGGTVLSLAQHFGMPRNDAEQLERDVASGAIAIGVEAGDRERSDVERIFRTNSARNVLESLNAS
jgi:hypothetical protein